MKKLTYDLHIHSCLSPCGDGDMTPNNIAGMAMLNGLRVAALTDHNTTRNCPAFFKACEKNGVVPIAGMELTTVEDIHMVCLFPTLKAAMKFDEYLDCHRMKIKNRPEIFGEQLIMDENDKIIDREENLLIPATDLDLTNAAQMVRKRGGAAFPAHIDKQANGMIATLASFPEEPEFAAAEFYDESKISEYMNNYPILKKMKILTNSDAHRLEEMKLNPPFLKDLYDQGSDDEIRQKVIEYIS